MAGSAHDPVDVRAARADERGALADLAVRAYAEFAQRLAPDAWTTMQGNLRRGVTATGEGVPLVATVGAAPAGFVLYFPPGRSDGVLFPAEWASVRLLGVDPAMRGRGVGRRLMQECLRRAEAQGAETFGLHTSELMGTARALYERMGFRVVRELDRRLGVRYWLFRLDLRERAADPGAGAAPLP